MHGEARALCTVACGVDAFGGRQNGRAGIPVRCHPPRPPRRRVSSWGGGCFARLSPRGQGRWELTLAPAASCLFVFSMGWAPRPLLFYFSLATWSRDSLRRSVSKRAGDPLTVVIHFQTLEFIAGRAIEHRPRVSTVMRARP